MVDYDVIVVGAGPIGSTYAYKMASLGYNVAIFDSKKNVGEPLQCAGLVSVNINDTKNLNEDFIKNKLKGAYLISPDSTSIKVEKKETVAYVLDRVNYDKYLLNRAKDAGVDIHLSSRVTNVDIDNTCISVGDKKYSSRIIVVSAGPNSKTAKLINPDLDEKYFNAIQFIIESDDIDKDYVILTVDVDILPGFIWTIPIDGHTQRMGLFTNASFKEAEEVLMNHIDESMKIIDKNFAHIPKFDKNKKLVSKNTFLLGDSASQVKPTTGGGLIAGFKCCEIAAKYSDIMLKENDNRYLCEYEKEYHELYDDEFKNQIKVQNILESLTEDDFNYMFGQLKENKVDKTISEYGDMDTQTPLIKELLKSGVIFKLLPKIGVRRLRNIWKSL